MNADKKDAINAIKAHDYETAARELLPLADNGDSWAQLKLGLIYRTGAGGTKIDYSRAFHYLLLAAKNNEWSSQYLVAAMYEEGQGVEKDDINALMWASISAGRGSAHGRELSAKLRPTVDPTDRQNVQKQVDDWFAATLIDGRSTDEYQISCSKLKLQLDEVVSFLKNVKTKDDANALRSSVGVFKWSSLAMIYPSGLVALSDIHRRGKGLLEIYEHSGCQKKKLK